MPDQLALDHAADLAAFVSASPSSFHAAAEGSRRLAAVGFVEQVESEPWSAEPGGHYLVRDGALMAWWVPEGADATTPFRIVGAHTDSPWFVLKPVPDSSAFGYRQLEAEVYGGVLLNSWLDRELGVAGRVVSADGAVTLVATSAIARIPQLAIHLDRGVNDGLTLDRQRHTRPVVGVGSGEPVLDLIARQAGVTDVIAHDLNLFVTEPPAVFGADGDLFASARLDNLASVHAALTALSRHADGPDVVVLAAFDHEEIGSATRTGAAGPILEDVLRRTTAAFGGGEDEFRRAVAGSSCVSADCGHAVHPNHPERHDPGHHPVLNGGPLLKINANQRYATDAPGEALWRRACAAVGVATRSFVSNNTMPCGSTIGPITATRLGLLTVDVGVPLLSMHSARELAGVADLDALSRALGAYWASE